MSFVHVASTTWTCEWFLTEVSFNMKFKFNKCLKDIATVFTDKFANCPLKSSTAWLMHSNRLDITLWRNRYNFVSSTGWRPSQRFPNCVRCSLLTGTVWKRMLQDTGTNQQTPEKAKKLLQFTHFWFLGIHYHMLHIWGKSWNKKCQRINKIMS